MKVVKELPISLLTMLMLRSKSFKESTLREKERIPVIVSLASIPSRLRNLDLVIRSILNQSVLPEKIILWLHQDLKNQLPKKLSNLEGSIFKIHYNSRTSSHRKLVHTRELYPKEIIITIDDDQMYRNDFLNTLYEEHLKAPNMILGNHTVHVGYDTIGEILPYKSWKNNPKLNAKVEVPIGAWGVLYPPHSLHEKYSDEKLYLELTPHADDLWFKAMALLRNTISKATENKPKNPIPIINTQKVALKKINLGQDKNTIQWKNLEKEFNLKDIITSPESEIQTK